MKKMEVSTPLALPEELEVTEVEMIDEVLTITAHSTQTLLAAPSVTPQHNGSTAITSAGSPISHLVENEGIKQNHFSAEPL